jgi:glycosyltransferase involved in cell wall biosynthesis
MRIAIITETFLPSVNGVVTRLCQSIRWLKEDGHEVFIITPDMGVSDFEGVPVAGIPTNSLFHLRKVKHLLQDFQPDVVHVVDPAIMGVSGLLYARRLKLPVIASYHSLKPQLSDRLRLLILKPILWWYLQTLHKRANLNLCTSESLLAKLQAEHFTNIHLWDHGVDANYYHPIRFDAAIRDRLTGGQKDKKLLLYVGRLAPENRIEKLREVFDKSAGFCLAIVGDGPHRAYLEQYFQDTDTVFTGSLYGDELASAYASSDIFVFPSTTKAAGLVFLEAMASGLPVVAAKCGPTSEQVNDSITGLLYDPAVEDDFIQLLSLLKDDGFRLKLGEQARTVSQMTGWDTSFEQLLDLYKETLEKHSPVRKIPFFR